MIDPEESTTKIEQCVNKLHVEDVSRKYILMNKSFKYLRTVVCIQLSFRVGYVCVYIVQFSST
jgi:hypothetical protein